MKKVLVAFIALSLFASLAFGKWVFKDAVVVGWPQATDGGYDKINCKGFKNPYSVTVDPDGKIWYAAYYPRFWYKMDENGQYVIDPATGKKVQIWPDDITIQKGGKDTTIHTYPIFIMHQDGKYDSLKFLPLPDGSVDTLRVGGGRGMDRDPQGNIIVAQYNAVYKIDYQTYAVLNKYQAPAYLARPAVDSSGYVFVKPQVGGSVAILDPDNFTIYNQIPDIPFDSRGLTVSPDGKNVYLSTYSAGGGVRHYYSADGVDGTYALVDTLIASVGATHFVQWDPAGLLWAASVEESARRIMWALDPKQNYAVVDSTSFTWFADNKADTTHPTPPLRGYAQPWHLRAPRDAAFSADGKTMYIADFYGYTIKAFEKEEAGVNPVTFKVNMSIQEQIGYFNPSTDKVVIRGGFNGWAGDADECTLGATPSVYELTKNFAGTDVGVTYEYKYVIMPGDKWETIGNRSFTVQAGGQVLDVVYYDNRTSAGATANVTWQADMSDMLQNNWFNPGTDTLRVTGAMNGWGDLPDWTTAQDLLDPSLFLLTKPLTYDAGTEIGWKFRAAPHGSFLDGGWEGGSNHTFIFNGSDMTLDKIKPNILPAGKDLTQDVTVRFTVNCNPPYNLDYFNKKPFPTVDGVYLNGDFVPLGAGGWGGWTVADTVGGGLIKMFDDGATKGDAVAGDNIWTTEVLFAAGSKGTHLYKYGLYSKGYTDTLNAGNIPMDNEAGFSMNHAVVISDAAPLYVAPMDNFGSQWNTAVERVPSSSIPVEFALQQNYPNPFNPTTEITYAIPEKAHVSLAVYNTVGQLIKRLTDGEQIAGSYRATWDGTDEQGTAVPSGVYFYRLQAKNFAQTMKMTLMK